MAKPLVIVTRKLPDGVETRMRELFDAELNLSDKPMGAKELKSAMARADVLVPTVTDRIDADVIAAASERLKLIANFGAGVDHIDVAAAEARGLVVTNTPGVLTQDTADITMALILAVPRRLTESERVLRSGRYQGWSPTWMMGQRLGGKRLGIVGMGRIGQAVAKRARAFDLQIHYHNRRPVSSAIETALEATYWADLDEMLARMDIISVNCPKTPSTYHLLDERRLGLLQNQAFIVNTSRGDVIDEAALADIIAKGGIAGAGLDVYEREPLVDERLLGFDNVVLLPHMGSATVESRTEMGEKVIINIKAWTDGHKPPDRLLPDMA